MFKVFWKHLTKRLSNNGGWIWPVIAAVAGAAAKASSTGKGGVQEVADPYGDVRGGLNSWLTSNIGQSGKKYGGEMVAPMSDEEKQSLGYLQDYGNYNLANDTTFQNAKSEINKTLTGDYDPATSPYYQAVKAGAEKNLGETQKNIASQAGGGGRFFSGARLKQQGEAAVDVNNSLDQLMGQLSLQERQNRLSAVNQALNISDTESKEGLNKATAFQTLGALPRTIQQAKDQAQLEDWIRSEYTWPTTIGQIAAGTQQSPLYQEKPKSWMENFMGSLCWVAAEIFGGWEHPKTIAARYYINYFAPKWFKRFYAKNGENIAAYIHNKLLLKILLRPLFECFAIMGRRYYGLGIIG